MDDAALVGVVDGVGHTGEEFEAVAGAEFLFLHLVEQRTAADEFHGEEGLGEGEPGSGLEFGDAGFVDGRDAGVLELAEDFGFELEALEDLARADAGCDDLQGHGAVRVFLAGFVDDAHAALPDLADDLVAADLPGQFVGVGFGRAVDLDGGGFEEAVQALGVALQQGEDECAEFVVAVTLCGEGVEALGLGQRDEGLEDRFGAGEFFAAWHVEAPDN